MAGLTEVERILLAARGAAITIFLSMMERRLRVYVDTISMILWEKCDGFELLKLAIESSEILELAMMHFFALR